MDKDKLKEHFSMLCKKMKQLLYSGQDFVVKELEHRKELLFPLKEKSLKKYKKVKEVLLRKKDHGMSMLEDLLKQLMHDAGRYYGFLLERLNHLKVMIIERVKSSREEKIRHEKRLNVDVKFLITVLFVCALVIPVFFFHACLEVYQQVCFRMCKIALVRAREHIVFDRKHMEQMSCFERLSCLLYQYCVGISMFGKEIFLKTESYWLSKRNKKL